MDHQIHINRGKPLNEAPREGHKRSHPDIRIRSGDKVTLDTRDALDGSIRPNSTAETYCA